MCISDLTTQDGMAIAGAVLHELATHTLALGFFATHYGSLTDDFAHVPTVRNMHMSTLVDDEKSEVRLLTVFTRSSSHLGGFS
jgi:DNA mismatch repair protein MSH6